VGEEGVVLEDQIHRPPVGWGLGEVVALHQDAAALGPFEAGDQAQGGGFAAAGGAQQGEELAGADREAEVVHGGPFAVAGRHTFRRLIAAAAAVEGAAAPRPWFVAGFFSKGGAPLRHF
jgi:hypothetical protein